MITGDQETGILLYLNNWKYSYFCVIVCTLFNCPLKLCTSSANIW